ncbi:MAG: exodeoxyribonuclease VII small subunit [Rikenellaceae bacterium]
MEKKLTYDEATEQIESILAKLRNNEISIDELSAEVKRATELITICRNRLLHSEEELKKILE